MRFLAGWSTSANGRHDDQRSAVKAQAMGYQVEGCYEGCGTAGRLGAAGTEQMSSYSSAARLAQLCEAAKACRCARSAGVLLVVSMRSTRLAKAPGSEALATRSVSSLRVAGRSVEATARPAARYSSVLSGKLPRLNALSR